MANGFRYRLNYIKLESMGIDVIMVWGCDIKRIIKDKMIEEEKTDYLANSIFFYAKIQIMARLFSQVSVFHSQIL